jgi:hypothetical protein
MIFWKEDKGQSLVLTAIFMGVVSLGFLALAVDTGMLFREKRIAQSAANAAAMGAATELAAGRSSNEQAVANELTTLNGFSTTPALTTLTSLNGVSSQYVQATVSKSVPTYFLGAFNKNLATVSVGATAVAGGGASSSTCICLEGTSGEDLNMNNAGVINAPNCGVVVDSTSSNAAVLNDGGYIKALSFGVVSTSWEDSGSDWINTNGNIQYTVTGVSACAPSMPTPPSYNSGSCTQSVGGSYVAGGWTFGTGGATTVNCYANMTVGANGVTDTINPGIYVITGYLTFDAGANGLSNKGGNGVFFYLPSGASLTIQNGANLNLVAGGNSESGGTTAPSTGYNGILLYQQTGNSNAITIQGGATSYINGALFAPSAPLEISNGTGTSITLEVVAKTLGIAGGATLNATENANVDEGSLSIGNPKLVQ